MNMYGGPRQSPRIPLTGTLGLRLVPLSILHIALAESSWGNSRYYKHMPPADFEYFWRGPS